ncbi:MAG TPA: septal ring lytic transglycosylase RlpA family protein [Casimicrobiaceae bacterium]|nr:septal ring lytic transglycosylase RlpA family protein [Casimicrobiaceae bacterium]
MTPSIAAPATPVPQPPITSPSSKYYADDGPPLVMPGNLDAIPDAVPKLEPLHRFANRPYTVLGRDYVPATMLRPYRERGIASWYGRKFHGQKTSIGEIYDMFAMTAAHPTLPLPSYVRVTNVMNGRSVVVRVNDRGPFLHGRVIDLSYAAAHRLDVASRGSGEVVVEALLPDEATPSVARLPAVAKSETDAVARPPVVAEAAQKETGFVVQLGAFANFANAQAFVSHVGNQMQAAQVEPRVRQSQGLWRVYVGPYAGREEARRVADRIASAFGLPASVSAQ